MLMKLTKTTLLEFIEQELQEIIRKSDDEYCLYSKKKNPKTGKARNLGCYSSKKGAENREKEVQYFKNVSEYKVETPKHFNPTQMPGTADDVFHDCIASVKKSFKKHKYPLKKGKTLEDAAAAICTDSRKEGGATLDWGIKRKREVEKARPGGKSGYEKDVKSG
jgi:hypothetical protein